MPPRSSLLFSIGDSNLLLNDRFDVDLLILGRHNIEYIADLSESIQITNFAGNRVLSVSEV